MKKKRNNKRGDKEKILFIASTAVVVIAVFSLIIINLSYKGQAATGKAVTGNNISTCGDTDGGYNVETQGAVYGVFEESNYSYSDECNGLTLKEWYCTASSPSSYAFDCSGNYTGCSNGACTGLICNTKTCAQLGKKCGSWNDECGKLIDCGVCNSGQTCSNGICVNVSTICVESDNGLNYNIYGTVTKGTSIYGDYCSPDGSNKLYERYCSNNNALTKIYSCPNKQACLNGACVNAICSDSDAAKTYITGKNYLLKGNVMVNNNSAGTDNCTGQNVVEYYCSGNSGAKGYASSTSYNCTKIGRICSNGACV
jgi:hypothetical protein